jgi:hypothetical protein
MWTRSAIVWMCVVVLAMGMVGCSAPAAQLDRATQAKLDEVIAMAREHAAEKRPSPDATPKSPAPETILPAEGTPAQFLSVEVSCDGSVTETKTTLSAWIVRAADGEGGERLQQVQLACPDKAHLGMPGPGDFIAVVDYNVAVPDFGGPPWAVHMVVSRHSPRGEEQLVKRSWKKGPSAPKGHVATKVTLLAVAAPKDR